MSLIAILISLFVERFIGSLEDLRRFAWFDRYTDRVREHLPVGGRLDGAAGVLIALAPPVALVALVNEFLVGLWLPFALLFAILSLLYSFGPRDLEAEVEAYVDALEREDLESAGWYAQDLLGANPPEDPRALSRALTEAILVEAHERLLGIIFWFVVLGPMGALLYRLACLLERRVRGEEAGFAHAVRRVHNILAWVPGRLCGLGYALSGSFVEAMHHWRREAPRWENPTRGVLVETGFGALRYDAEAGTESASAAAVPVKEALSLAKRTVLVWLTALALATLAGWSG